MGEKFGNDKGADIIDLAERRKSAEEGLIIKKIEKLKGGADYEIKPSVLADFIADHHKDKPDNVNFLLRRVRFFRGTFANFSQSKKAGKTVLFKGELDGNKGIFFIPLKNIGIKTEFIPGKKSKQ
jgi:hypothetical protein